VIAQKQNTTLPRKMFQAGDGDTIPQPRQPEARFADKSKQAGRDARVGSTGVPPNTVALALDCMARSG
jgi:hypothetical protein